MSSIFRCTSYLLTHHHHTQEVFTKRVMLLGAPGKTNFFFLRFAFPNIPTERKLVLAANFSLFFTVLFSFSLHQPTTITHNHNNKQP